MGKPVYLKETERGESPGEAIVNLPTGEAWTVSQLTRYLQALVHSQEALQNLWVRGEVSTVSRPASGHVYFTLKDERAQIRCVVWREDVDGLEVQPEQGQAVEVHGYLDIYGPRGTYQLYVDQIRPLGEGALFQAFLRLKARLEAEGLFAAHRKQPLPPFPRVIGVVTSLTGAALRDILNTLRRRYPLVEVWLAPTLVQGEEAPRRVVAALERMIRASPDVIILARGGGSLEDLWAFNDERVVRAVAESPIPVVTGVGHETDFTLVDFAADRRAPTPTGAAEMATPDREELIRHLDHLRARMVRAMERVIRFQEQVLLGWNRRLNQVSPVYTLRQERLRLDELSRRMTQAILYRMEREQLRLSGWQQRLHGLDPTAPLQRGYAWVLDERGRLVREATQVRVGERVHVRLHRGRLVTRVEDVHPEEDETLRAA